MQYLQQAHAQKAVSQHRLITAMEMPLKLWLYLYGVSIASEKPCLTRGAAASCYQDNLPLWGQTF